MPVFANISPPGREAFEQQIRLCLWLFLLWIAVCPLQAQPLYRLEERLMHGDPQALFDIAPYFDSRKRVRENLGYHIFHNLESDIAKRIVLENCFFTDREIRIGPETGTRKFLDFLRLQQDRIEFSNMVDGFFLTPFEDRELRFEIREIPGWSKPERAARVRNILASSRWVKQTELDSYLSEKDPACLLIISAELLRRRYRWNRYDFFIKDYTDLIEYLTGTTIAVEDNKKQLCPHPGQSFDPEVALHLFIFFSKYYKNYSWNEQEKRFALTGPAVRPIDREAMLFSLLNDPNDSVARDAYVQLTRADARRVQALTREYEYENLPANFGLPLRPYVFLDRLVELNEYCRAQKIDLDGPDSLNRKYERLKGNLSFAERRALEDTLIRELTLDQIAAFEYRALIDHRSWDWNYSAGRVIDVFYSMKWDSLLQNKHHLDCYLKKAGLISHLKTRGSCNNYLVKFRGTPRSTRRQFRRYASNDPDIREQAALVYRSFKKIRLTKDGRKIKILKWNDYPVANIRQEADRLFGRVTDSLRASIELDELLARSDYAQLGPALELVRHAPLLPSYKRYDFIEKDWGLFMAGDLAEPANLTRFLELYRRLSEFELYELYLKEAGIRYKNPDGSPDYDRIFDLLKFDVVSGFVAGNTEGNEVYALIRILEHTFRTRLGFPRKLYDSIGEGSPDVHDRVRAWLRYLKKHHLLRQAHDEPPSFHFR